MDADPVPSAQFVVIPIGIDLYEQFPELKGVKDDLLLLRHVCCSEPFRREGFDILHHLTGKKHEIEQRLTELGRRLAVQPRRLVVISWSGHGRVACNGTLRLAASDSLDPMSEAEGVAVTELVHQLTATKAQWLCLFVDVCQAGMANADIAKTVIETFRGQPSAVDRCFGVVSSCHAFQTAEDGRFMQVLERILREGPSHAARERIAERGYGSITRRDRLLTFDEINDLLKVEFELFPKRLWTDRQRPEGLSIGKFALFPNPLYRENEQPLEAEVARQLWLRPADVESHFLPKARGLDPQEPGWFFSGRREVARVIVDWLQSRGPSAPHNLFVLTGGGGTGKSAIIGRLVALSDEAYRRRACAEGWNEASDRTDGTVPEAGRIDAALHLRRLTTHDAATALSDLLGLAKPVSLASFVNTVPTTLKQSGTPITVVLDALDESEEPELIVDVLIRPLVHKGWRILLGTRRFPGDGKTGDLATRVGLAYCRSLDEEEATAVDIAEYVQRRLADTKASPYRDLPDHVTATAKAIAEHPQSSFLYARLTADLFVGGKLINLEQLPAELPKDVGDAYARIRARVDAEFRKAFPNV